MASASTSERGRADAGSYRGPDRRSSPAYRGPDRRSTPPTRGPQRTLTIVAAFVVLAAGVVTVLADDQTGPGTRPSSSLEAAVGAAIIVVGLIAAAVSIFRWRLVGDAASLLVGTALGFLALGCVAPDLVALAGILPTNASVLVAARAGSLVTVVVLVARAAGGPTIDARLRPARLLTRATLGAVLAGVVAVLVPGLDAIGRLHILGRDATNARAGHLVLAIVFGLLAAAFLARSRKDQRRLNQTTCVVLGCIGAAEVFLMATASTRAVIVASLAMRLVGAVAALGGAGEALRHSYLEQQERLFDARQLFDANDRARQAEETARQERVHDARSAVLAIDAAAHSLETHFDALAVDTRASLARAIRAEIALLGQLIDSDVPSEPAVSFSVREIVEPLVTCQQAAGRPVELDVVDELRVVGRRSATVEALQNVLENAARHAAGSPVLVSAIQQNGQVLVRVEDRGPGVPDALHDAIFERATTTSADGLGLGLHISRRLMREQGGDLWVQNGMGGGAVFVLALPTASLVPRTADDRRAQPVDDVQKSWQVGELDAADPISRH